MGKFSNLPRTTQIGDRLWRVEDDFTYTPKKYPPVTIKAGYETDGASVPRLLWSLIPPFGKHFYGAIVHDRLYKEYKDITSPIKRSRKQCDDIFLEAMKDLGVNFTKRYTIYWAVRGFGWAH